MVIVYKRETPPIIRFTTMRDERTISASETQYEFDSHAATNKIKSK